MSHTGFWRGTGVMLVAFAVLSVSQVWASSESVLWSFGGPGDGKNPYAELITDWKGSFYGTTLNGGGNDAGTVFKLTRPAQSGAPWTETLLWSFGGPGDGSNPYAGLLWDQQGNLYGTTQNGGANGQGAVYELSAPIEGETQWTETILWSFSGPDGANPYAGLIWDKLGNLYGTTKAGGVNGKGTVFELSPPSAEGAAWSENVLWNLGNGSGGSPEARLIMDSHGNLYGTNSGRGIGPSSGSVFQLVPPAPGQTQWSYREIAQAGDIRTAPCTFGANRLAYAKGDLYSACTVRSTKSRIFQLTPSDSLTVWKRTTIWEFGSQGTGVDGVNPQSGVIADPEGNLYGTTVSSLNGGQITSDGTVFELIRPASDQSGWEEKLLWTFGQTPGDGLNPYSSLIYANGQLFGTTANGGASGAGTVFSITP